jgi:hypothetical protein
MLFPIKQVLAQYKTLVVNMNDDLHIVATTKINSQYIYEIEMVMGLTCTMPLLEAIHVFIKFMQFVTHF